MVNPQIARTWSQDGVKFAETSDGQVVEVGVLDPVNTDPIWKDRGKHRPPIKAPKSSRGRVQKCRDRQRRGVRLVTMRLEVTDEYLNEKVREGQIPAEALNDPAQLNRAMTLYVEALMGL